jgi:hypothetical protein
MSAAGYAQEMPESDNVRLNILAALDSMTAPKLDAASGDLQIGSSMTSAQHVKIGSATVGVTVLGSLGLSSLGLGLAHIASDGTVSSSKLATADIDDGQVTYAKLSVAGAITSADLAGSIAYGKLSLSGAIQNSDLAGSIAYSKLSLTGAIQNADLAGSIAYNKLSLAGSIVNADVSSIAQIAGFKVVPAFVAQNISTTGTLQAGATTIGTSLTTASGSTVTFGGLSSASAGVVHASTTGQLSKSLIVTADISDAQVTYAKMSLGGGQIQNADLSSGISGSKVTLTGLSQNISTSGSLGAGSASFSSATVSGALSAGASTLGATTVGGAFSVGSAYDTTLAKLGTGVVHADSTGKLSSSTIVDADVSSSAAIAFDKLALTDGSKAISTSGSISVTGGANGMSVELANGGHILVNVNGTISGLSTPSNGASDISATKGYVDSLAQGLNAKQAAKVGSTSQITLSGLPSLGGYQVVAGDRVAAMGQSNPVENGIWIAASGAWSRAADMAAGSNADANYFFVMQGSLANYSYVCTNASADIVGTDALTFVQFSAAGVYSFGDGLQNNSNTISVKGSDGISVGASGVAVNASSSGGLSTSGGSLAVKLPANSGLASDINGLAVSLASPSGLSKTGGLQIVPKNATLAVDSTGLYVQGVPAQFTIGATATSSNVTADNMSALVAGNSSAAHSLHSHHSVDAYITASGAITKGDPIYVGSAADAVSKAAANDSTARWVVGVACADAADGAATHVVFSGVAPGALAAYSIVTPGQKFYMNHSGGLTRNPSADLSSGDSVFFVGTSINATDLLVDCRDYGQRAA